MHYYSNTAGAMTLVAGVGAADTSITLDTVTGLPVSFPYSLTLDYGLGSEEVVDVTAAAGTTLTVTRGVDGTSAQSHSAAAPVRHVAVARDLREPQQHIAATSGVHGVTGSVVGTTDAQTLELKTFQSSVNTETALTVKAKAGQTAPLAKILNSAGATLWTFDGDQVFSDAATLRTSVSGAFWGEVVKLLAPLGKKALSLVADATEAAGTKVLEVLKGASSVFSVTAGGNVAHTGSLSTGGTAAVTGALTAGSVTTAGAVSAGSVASTGAVTGSNLPAVPADKAGKRSYWGTYTGVTDASGYLTITHGAGFTPSAAWAANTSTTGTLPMMSPIDSLGAATLRVRCFTPAGSAFASSAVSLFIFMAE